TKEKVCRPRWQTSTSTWTSRTSMPSRLKVRVVASTPATLGAEVSRVVRRLCRIRDDRRATRAAARPSVTGNAERPLATGKPRRDPGGRTEVSGAWPQHPAEEGQGYGTPSR